MRLLVTLADYDASESFSYSDKVWSLAATAGSVFALLWVIQYAAYFVYRGLPKALNKPEYVTKFGRHTMDIISMVAFAYMGFEALGMPPFRSWDSLHTMTTVAGKVLQIGHARSYIFSASAQRLCVWQVAYQAKNFCDAVIHDDGPLFLAHHVVTGLLSALALKPFLHVYCAYFLGVSEISTAILCGLVLFDEDRGVPPLAKMFPALMQVTGAAFAVSFITFRIILWPYACYYFWIDMLAMLSPAKPSEGMHSFETGCIFMVVNVLLTLLQFYWLSEIIAQAYKFFTEGAVSMKKSASADKLAEDAKIKKKR